MAPRRVVEVQRWQVVGAFLVLVGIAVGVAWWNDYRIDQAEKRVTSNRASVADLRRANEAQNALRGELVAEARRVDLIICRDSNALKERIRATVRVRETEFRQALMDLGIDPDSRRGQSLFKAAKAREAEALERFKLRNCKALTTRP